MSHEEINIAAIRTDYTLATLDENTVGDDPFHFFEKWFKEAEAAHISEINAMTLATVDNTNRPHARIVLLKGLEHNGFVFFTNYNSAKGNQIAANNHAALLFFWKELERQVRIEGIIEKLPDTDNDEYFNSRPSASRIGAWASPQSEIIPNRSILDKNYNETHEKYAGTTIPRPPHWGGYRLVATQIEFWQGRSSRMHDRILFTKGVNIWTKHRLAP